MKRIALVGAGHAHMEALHHFRMHPIAGMEIVLVNPGAETLYSGMLPGYVAHQYSWREVVLCAHAAATRCGAVFLRDQALEVRAAEREILLAERPPLSFDYLSLDIGSYTHLPFASEEILSHARFLSTRPFLQFQAKLEEWDRLRGTRLIVAGSGHGGVELALAFARRYPQRKVILLEGENHLAQGLRQALEERGVGISRPGRLLEVKVNGEELRLSCEREKITADFLVAATGARAHPLVAHSRLPEKDGYLLVENTLQAVGNLPVFGAGDCVHFKKHPWVPKSGVYAVREGVVLAENLRAISEGRRLREYSPQRHTLKLLNTADGKAIALRNGLRFSGRWVWALKDRIDRKFIEKHNPEALPMQDPACGGCGSKLSAATLRKVLSSEKQLPGRFTWGIQEAEDIALWQSESGFLGFTVDQFRNFGVDPFLFGRIAAVSAASDLIAKGVRPQGALMALTVPAMAAALAEGWIRQLFAGVQGFFQEEGIELGGGQTNEGEEWNLGFTFWGQAPESPIKKTGGRPGDNLYLSKPIGTGVLLAAAMAGAPVGRDLDHCLRGMSEVNRLRVQPNACTDVTGFGLIGHLSEMLGSGLGAELQLSSIPFYAGAQEWFAKGFQSRMHTLNQQSFPFQIPAEAQILHDPQTSGGLLFSLPESAPAPEGSVCIGRLIDGRSLPLREKILL